MKSAISIKNLTKRYNDFTVIDDFSLEVESGSITSILAPSGAGKTTLLRIISGLSKSTGGEVLLDGKAVVEPTSNIGFMFQENSAFPWLTVRENVEFGMRLAANKHAAKSQTQSKIERSLQERSLTDSVEELCRELGVEKFLDYYPSQLSGGQKQRVVIARSLILQPKVLLCDEPFSSLDELTRSDLRQLLLSLHRNRNHTIVFITHSVEEAIFIGNYLVICSGPPLREVTKLKVEFERQRDSSLVDTEEFRKIRSKVKKILTQNRNQIGGKVDERPTKFI